MNNHVVDQTENTSSSNTKSVSQFLWRLVASAIVLAITAFFTPGFTISSVWSLILATLVLTFIDYLISTTTGLRASAFGKGFVGFVLAAIVLYSVQFFVAGYLISWLGAIIGALIYGVVDYFIPGNE